MIGQAAARSPRALLDVLLGILLLCVGCPADMLSNSMHSFPKRIPIGKSLLTYLPNLFTTYKHLNVTKTTHNSSQLRQRHERRQRREW